MWPYISQLLHPFKIPGVEAALGMYLMNIFTYAVIKKEFIRGSGLLPQLAFDLAECIISTII